MTLARLINNTLEQLDSVFSGAVKQLPKEKPFLLLIDLDAYYLNERSIDDEYKRKIQNFLDLNRHRYTVIHVWHDANDPEDKEPYKALKDEISVSSGTMTPVLDERFCKYLPLTNPRPGDWVIGKVHYSAFQRTDLRRSLPESATILIAGAYGEFCIDYTVQDACDYEFNTVALEDLIYKHDDSIKRIAVEPRALEYNAKVLNAMAP